jgi:hypothetical protein
MGFIRVIVESPFANEDKFLFERNKRYLEEAMLDCLKRGEAPFASHKMYTQCLDDNVPEQRELGIQAGFAWRSVAEKTVVYTDLGISRGMQYGIEHATKMGHVIDYRSLEGWAPPEI